MNTSANRDPFQVLGVPQDASEETVRARYLQLVKQFPPDREPEKFREVRAAYDATKDVLSIAKRLAAPPSEVPPEWSDTLENQRKNAPKMSAEFVLSLGNRSIGPTAAANHQDG